MYIFSGFGQVGTPDEIANAAKGYAQQVANGSLMKCKDLGQSVSFAFDPKQPNIIYALAPYLGNGPGGPGWPYFKSIAPAKYEYAGPSPLPWVGEVPVDQWLPHQSPDVQDKVKVLLGMAPPPVALSPGSVNSDPMIASEPESNAIYFIGGGLLFVVGLLLILRNRQ